jgi:hypothetical protein
MNGFREVLKEDFDEAYQLPQCSTDHHIYWNLSVKKTLEAKIRGFQRHCMVPVSRRGRGLGICNYTCLSIKLPILSQCLTVGPLYEKT